MAVSGMVYKTYQRNDLLKIYLAPVERDDGYADPVGQERLFVRNPTYLPKPGDIMWGGADMVILAREGKPDLRYRRTSYVFIAEDFSV